jgi:peptidoglycan/xylan/chitin deacetylase (PgdA/CDA1 family)
MRRLGSRIRRWFRPRGGPVILMYHRIATPVVDPWDLAVSPERFSEQLEALCAHRTLLSVDSFVTRLQLGDLPPNAAALTFDDGYIDNLLCAKPVLEAARVPATMFITTGLIGTGEEFWWDELARMILLRAEPLSVTVTVETDCLQIELPPCDPGIEPRRCWRAWDPPVTAREHAYKAIWLALLDRAPESRKAVIEQLRGVFGTTRPNPKDLPMGVEDIRKLVSDWVSVGAHGRFHQPLTSLPAIASLQDMEKSREEAEALSASAVTGFAYPHGARDPEIVNLARRAGYRWACCANENAIDRKRADLHDLPRVAVGDWSGQTLLTKLRAVST